MRPILLASLLGVFAFGVTALAGELPKPVGPVILTVSGAIHPPAGQSLSADGAVLLDRAALLSLGEEELKTSTAFTDGVKTFRGVPIGALLKAVGATGASVRAYALNDYHVDIPVAEFDTYRALLAVDMDEVAMSPRDKGYLLNPVRGRTARVGC